MSFSSSGHKKPDGLIFIFSLLSSVNFSEGVKSGGCFGRTGSEMRGSDGIGRRIQCSSGRVIRMGWTQFAAFLYREVARASNGCLLGSGDMLGLADVFGSGDAVGSGVQSVGGPIADEHGPKSELYSRKASVIGLLSWSNRPLIVLLGHPSCLDRGALRARDGLSIWEQSFLMVLVSMTFLGDDLPRISVLHE